MKTIRFLPAILALILAAWWSQPSASAAINAAANRTALSANRTINWTAMGTLGVNVGNSEPVSVSGFGTVEVSCSSGVLAQTRQSLAGGTGDFGGNFSPNDPLCYTTGAPITLSFGGKFIRSLGFNVQSEALGAFTARRRFYDGAAGGGSLLRTLTVNGNSTAANNGAAIFLAGVSDNASTDFKSVLIDLTAAASVPAKMAINNVSFRELLPPIITNPLTIETSTATTATASAGYDLRGSGYETTYLFRLYNSPTAPFPEQNIWGTVNANGPVLTATFSDLWSQRHYLWVEFEVLNSLGSSKSARLLYDHLGPAAPGARDFTFSDNGIQITPFMDGATLRGSQARDVVVQSDGKIVVVGFASNGNNNDFAIARYHTDGTLDTSLGGTGLITTSFGSGDDRLHAVALQPDGKIVVAGEVWNGTRYVWGLIRYLSNGGTDTSFDGGSVALSMGNGNGAPLSVAVQSDGRIVAAGYVTSGTNVEPFVVRLNADGTVDNGFGSGGNGLVNLGFNAQSDVANDVILQADGKIVVAGHTHFTGARTFALWRLNANGTPDNSFDGDGRLTTAMGTVTSEAYSLALQRDGGIVAAGYAYDGSSDDFAVARYLPNGALDTSFHGDGKVTVSFGNGHDNPLDMAIQPDGKIVAAGWSPNGTHDDMAVLRLNPDGSLDTTFDGDGKVILNPGPGYDRLYAVAVAPDGGIAGAGYSDNASLVGQFAVVKLIGGPNELLVNGGFEANESLGGGISTTFGDWKQDIAANVGTENGITPFEGMRMAKFLGTTDSGAQAGNADGDISQYVDLSAYAAQIAAGNVTVQVTARFNRVAGDANTDTAFRILLIARSGSITTSPSTGSLGGNSVELISDGNPTTWETLTNTWTLPPGTTNLFVNPYAKENVQDNGTAPEFAGHYMDGVTLTLLIPQEIQVEQPVGTIFTDAASTVDFGSTPLGTPVTRTFRVTNRGGEDLHVTGLTLPVAYEYVGTFAPFTLAPNATQDFQIRFLANTVKGVFSGAMALLSDDADEGSFDLALTGRAIIGGNPAALDFTFDGDGRKTTPFGGNYAIGDSVVVQSDGKIVVAGYSGYSDQFFNYSNFAVARYGADGALDPTFNGGGKITTGFGSDYALGLGVALQNDGKIVVAGTAFANGTSHNFALARYTTAGALDSNFGTGGKVTTVFGNGTDQATDVAVQTDGKIIAAGFAHSGGSYDFAVARYLENGAMDPSFGTGGKVTTDFGGSDLGYGVALQSDGAIIVAGNSSGTSIVLARYTTSGALDSTFGIAGKVITAGGGANAVKVQSDGKIVVAGYSYDGSNADFALLRYTTSGALDTSFGNGGIVMTAIGVGDDRAESVALQGDGRIIVAGYASNGSNADFAMARYLPSGALDVSFGGGGTMMTAIGSGVEQANSVALQGDGRIVAAGFSNSGGPSEFAVVRYGGDLQPTVTTFTGTAYSPFAAGLSGSVNPNGVITNAWFEWGLTAAYGQTTASQPVGYGTVAATIGDGISGLTPGTLYHFRIVAQNGETTAYGADATFLTPLNNNADLSGLTLSAGTLSPEFFVATTNYTANVPYAVSSITVTPTLADGNASVTVNGSIATSGSPSAGIILNVGANTIDVQVRAQNGTTTQTYSVVVTRAGSPNADLSALLLGGGLSGIDPVALAPGFNSGTTSYTASVPFNTASIGISALAADFNASILVMGGSGNSIGGSYTGYVAFGSGNTTMINITVIAQDGLNFQTYTVDVSRQTAIESWRQTHFGTTENAGDAADDADPDGDGWTNHFEFVAGLAPTDPASRFSLRVERVTGQPGRKAIVFSPRLTDRSHVVKYTTSLIAPMWTDLVNITTDDNIEERIVTDLDATDAARFYQVEITRP